MLGDDIREIFRHVAGIMRADARPTLDHRNARLAVFTLKIARQVEIETFVTGRLLIGRRWSGSESSDLARFCPFE